MNTKTAKPKKRYKDFPLFPQATQFRAKKIRRKLHDFAPWKNPDDALKKVSDSRG